MVFGTVAKVTFVGPNNSILSGMQFFNNKSSSITVHNIKELLPNGSVVDVLYNVELTTFNDIVNLSMTIKDIKI